MRLIAALGVYGVSAALFAQKPVQSELQKAVEEFKTQTRSLGLRPDSPPQSRKSSSAGRGFHGRLFYNLRNDFIDAVPHEVKQRGGDKRLLRRNQFGFNVSGPVIVPKLYHGGGTTFFSFTYEGMREKIGRSYLRTIPTLPERAGDWSAVVDQAGSPLPVYDPLTTSPNPAFNPAQPVSTDNLQYLRQPFANNAMPAARLDPAAQRALQLYPAPNTDVGPFFRNNYFILSNEESSANGVTARADHSLRERHRFGFSLTYSNGVDGAAPWFPNIANPGPVVRQRRDRRAGIEHIFTQSPRNINTFSVDVSTDQSENKPQLDEQGRAFPNYRFLPYLSMGRSYPISRNARNTFVLGDSFSTRAGLHRLRFSGRYIREQVNSFWPQYPSGSYRFSDGLTSLPGIVNTGHAFASFLLGGPDYAETSIVSGPSYFRRGRFLLTVADQWDILKGLTLSWSLNLDGSAPRVEKYDRQSTVDMNAVNPANGRNGAMVFAGLNGAGRSFQPFLTKLEPSASLAWSLLGDQRTLLRAAYSRSYSPIPVYLGQWGTQGFNGTPTVVSPNPQLQPAFRLQDGFPPLHQPLPDLRPEAANNTIADLVEASGRQPTYQSCSLSLERDLPASAILTVGFGHSQGRNLLVGSYAANPNAIRLEALSYRDLLNDEAFNRSLRPFPHYQGFDVHSSWPGGRYQRDAGFVRVEKRTSGGLAFSAYYEFSKQMDDYSGPYGVQDYYNRRNEWSMTAYNSPHRMTLTYIYELPFGPNKPFLAGGEWRRHLVEGWSLSGTTTVASGEPIALRPQFNNTGRVVDALNVDVVPGVDPNVSNQGAELWFNPAAFEHPEDFAIGNAARTHPTLRNPVSQNHDLSVTKRISVTPEQSMEFSAVGFNFLNHANWSEPDPVIGPPGARNVNTGKIIGSIGGRIIQLGLRYSF